MCLLLLIHHFTAVSLNSYPFLYWLSFLSIPSCIPHHGWYYLNSFLPNHSRSIERKKVKSCPTLCNPMDCSLLGSSVHGLLQAGKLECIAIPFSRGSSHPKDRKPRSPILQVELYRLSHQGSPPESLVPYCFCLFLTPSVYSDYLFPAVFFPIATFNSSLISYYYHCFISLCLYPGPPSSV